MIIVHVVSKSQQQVKHLAETLISERLMLDGIVLHAVDHYHMGQNALLREKRYILMGKTKALLFTKIDERIRELCTAQDLPEIYSLPIVNMDWEQSKQLKEEVLKL